VKVDEPSAASFWLFSVLEHLRKLHSGPKNILQLYITLIHASRCVHVPKALYFHSAAGHGDTILGFTGVPSKVPRWPSDQIYPKEQSEVALWVDN
jgi:hypothetical protein